MLKFWGFLGLDERLAHTTEARKSGSGVVFQSLRVGVRVLDRFVVAAGIGTSLIPKCGGAVAGSGPPCMRTEATLQKAGKFDQTGGLAGMERCEFKFNQFKSSLLDANLMSRSELSVVQFVDPSIERGSHLKSGLCLRPSKTDYQSGSHFL